MGHYFLDILYVKFLPTVQEVLSIIIKRVASFTLKILLYHPLEGVPEKKDDFISQVLKIQTLKEWPNKIILEGWSFYLAKIMNYIQIRYWWHTVCPRSSDQFDIVYYYIKRVTTSWPYGMYIVIFSNNIYAFEICILYMILCLYLH